MKKKMKTLVFALLTAGLLTACGEKPSVAPDSTDSAEVNSGQQAGKGSEAPITEGGHGGHTSQEESVSSSAKEEVTIEDFLYNLSSTHRANIKNTYYSIDYLGDDAMYFNAFHSKYASKQGGYVSLGDKGLWTFDKAEDTKAFELGSLIYAAMPTDTSGKQLDLSDALSYYEPMVNFADSVDSWSPVKGYNSIYTIDETDAANEAALKAIAGLESYIDDSNYVYKATKVKMAVTDNHTAEISCKVLKYKASTTTELYSTLTPSSRLKITLAGTDTVDGLDDFLANPVIPAYTDWGSDVKADFSAIFGSNFTLPFVTGLTRGYQLQDDNDGKGNVTQMQIVDLLSGDLTTAFTAALTADSWINDGTQESNGMTIYTFHKVITAQDDTAKTGEKDAIVEFAFTPSASTKSPALYPNGEFMVYATVQEQAYLVKGLDKVNTTLATILKADKTAALPALNFGTATASDLTLGDYTVAANTQFAKYGITVSYYWEITGSFADGATALTATTTWLNDLTTAGYAAEADDTTTTTGGDTSDTTATATPAETLASENSVEVSLTDTAFKALGALYVDISLTVDKTTKARTGAFTIIIMG